MHWYTVEAQSSSLFSADFFWHPSSLPLPLTPTKLKLLAGWPVHDSEHHTSVFGNVLTEGMSCPTLARVDSVSLILPQSGSDRWKWPLKSFTIQFYHCFTSEVSEHRKRTCFWNFQTYSWMILRSHMPLYVCICVSVSQRLRNMVKTFYHWKQCITLS